VFLVTEYYHNKFVEGIFLDRGERDEKLDISRSFIVLWALVRLLSNIIAPVALKSSALSLPLQVRCVLLDTVLRPSQCEVYHYCWLSYAFKLLPCVDVF
jgi:hypothetical protein